MMMPVMKIFTWRCKCGIRIKVLADSDNETSMVESIINCPRCNDPQAVKASNVISVTQDREETIRPTD
jgi:hypothetical protein